MKKKFKMLEDERVEKITKKADLLENKESKKTKNIMLYDVPADWNNLVKKVKFQSFNSYAKQAILEALKKDKIL